MREYGEFHDISLAPDDTEHQETESGLDELGEDEEGERDDGEITSLDSDIEHWLDDGEQEELRTLWEDTVERVNALFQLAAHGASRLPNAWAARELALEAMSRLRQCDAICRLEPGGKVMKAEDVSERLIVLAIIEAADRAKERAAFELFGIGHTADSASGLRPVYYSTTHWWKRMVVERVHWGTPVEVKHLATLSDRNVKVVDEGDLDRLIREEVSAQVGRLMASQPLLGGALADDRVYELLVESVHARLGRETRSERQDTNIALWLEVAIDVFAEVKATHITGARGDLEDQQDPAATPRIKASSWKRNKCNDFGSLEAWLMPAIPEKERRLLDHPRPQSVARPSKTKRSAATASKAPRSKRSK